MHTEVAFQRTNAGFPNGSRSVLPYQGGFRSSLAPGNMANQQAVDRVRERLADTDCRVTSQSVDSSMSSPMCCLTMVSFV